MDAMLAADIPKQKLKSHELLSFAFLLFPVSHLSQLQVG